MGAIDGFDQMLYCYLDERRTVKYWKKVTFNLFSRMLLNSYILYQTYCLSKNIKPLDRYQYMVSIISEIGMQWMKERNNDNNGAGDNNRAQPAKELLKLPGKQQKTCWVCSNRGGHTHAARERKRSRLECSRCHEGCHYQCFSKHKCT